MSRSEHPHAVPRGALVAAAMLVGASILLAGLARTTGVGTLSNPTSSPVESRELRFEDRPDGAVAVYAVGSDRVVDVLAPGTNGFIRSVLRGLARERKLRGIGREPGFRLTRWADGRLSIEDPSTGRSVELGAFGPANSSAFARLLSARAE